MAHATVRYRTPCCSAIITMKIETDSPLQIMVRLYGGGRVIQRYMLPLAARKQIIAFSKLGYEKADNFETVDRIMLVVHAANMKKIANIRLGAISISDNQYQFYQTVAHTDAPVVVYANSNSPLFPESSRQRPERLPKTVRY